MSLRKQAQYVPTGISDEENNLNGEHQPFLTLEETTTAETAIGTIPLGNHDAATQDAISAPRKRLSQHEINGDVEDGSSSRHDDDNDGEKPKPSATIKTAASSSRFCSFKKAISYSVFGFLFVVIWESLMVAPEDRWFQMDAATDSFLIWVQGHPLQGLLAIVIVIAVAVVLLIPIGTPLTLGCGYIYKGAYGWKIGLTIATIVSMGGSALGAVMCFLLGRYFFRDRVRQWARNTYPLFDAIDAAAAEHGLKIMAMLYLTPILPLGPVSYMCGTTSMALTSFVLAKVASLPLMLLYCFIGASTRSLISSGKSDSSELKSIEENETLIVSGILLSFVMIAGITTYIKKELNAILERQGKHKPGEKNYDSDASSAKQEKEDTVELAPSRTAASARHRRAA
mmetsp:Transcript_22195/g.61673  ORF Transcript_22195/g.61673 Transcript_22195/m.61673 type:complete len:398 (-) Transcript_22195:758-1951(-)|eukprot:CAMPEP_0168832420 /NCGR_PEP_ID=MMETSP0727-20121128/2548_1 /TAXON_ID=265536 /ORGANISM="Amphiprora sp., Strain CCMP467" /LENGTH=397 /DNA_ID=CAMNT_0008885703 /DNA_START=142 /DNA_END=1335 /DNA_ORIENTATION=+